MPWENPRDLEDKVPIRYSDKESSQVRILANPNGFERSNHHNVFEVSSPSFSLGDSINSYEMVEDIKELRKCKELLSLIGNQDVLFDCNETDDDFD